MKKIAWMLYYTIGFHLPKSNAKISFGAKKIRAFLVKRFARQVGKNVNIQCKVTISRKLVIGNNSGIGIGSSVQGDVVIGNDVMIGPECYIYTQNHKHNDLSKPMITQGYEEEKKVIIADDVWIGSRVTILPGVTIGKGAIIGASTVVTKNVPPYSIFCGNPGVVVKMRGEINE